jgi:ferredoxin-nitrite reductase
VFKGSDLKRAGKLSNSVGGSIRLSVEQSFYIITDNEDEVKSSDLFSEYSKYHNTYFNHQIACAGTATCAFGVIPNKPDAIEMAEFLQKEVPIKNAKVRMYWSACPKGCGIHGIADIGFEGCIAKDEDGNKVDGVHILIGGKATSEVAEAKIYAKAVPLTQAKYIVKELMEKYRDERINCESFESFESRVEIKSLV